MNKLLITLCASSLVFNSQAGSVQSREEIEKEASAMREFNLLQTLEYKLSDLSRAHDKELSRHRLNVESLTFLNTQASSIINIVKEAADHNPSGKIFELSFGSIIHNRSGLRFAISFGNIIEDWASKEDEALKKHQSESTQNENDEKLQKLSSLNEELYNNASELNTLLTKISFKSLEESQIQPIPAPSGSNKSKSS